MRIDSVRAAAFGPFIGHTLKLYPGMNVVYGPNESGKSSWHACIYAALCGMRRSRGQPTREDRVFANQHRPWRGTPWRVTAHVTLDDGRTIELEQGLGPGGRSAASDTSTGKALTGELTRDGAVDATTLLGLTRETALATIFVRQADILRVVADAAALQEYLERAAAASTVDTTADEALARIAEYKREHIGVLRAGARGPLAAASRQLRDARGVLDEAEARFESYQQLSARKRSTGIELCEAEGDLAGVLDHERERAHRERWREILIEEHRLRQARELEREASALPHDRGPGRELVARVTRAVAAYDNRPPEPSDLVGSTAEALEREITELPEHPTGDLEPAPEVTAAFDKWRAEIQRVAAHGEHKPDITATVDLPAPAVELRRLADDLEVPTPEIDRSLAEEVERRRAAVTSIPAQPTPLGSRGESRSLAPILGVLVVGAFIAVVGVALAVVGKVTVGVIAILAGTVVSSVGVAITLRARAAHRGSVPPPPFPPAADLELTRLEARLVLQEESRAHAERRRQGAAARVTELGLPVSAVALRRLAADADAASAKHARYAEWERRQTELADAFASAFDDLRASFIDRGAETGAEDDLEHVFACYVADCRERRELARQAGRRADLEAQLASRRAAQAARDHDLAARADAERELVSAGEAVGRSAVVPDYLANDLRAWVRAEEAKDDARQKFAQINARLDQLLDGRTIKELEGEIEQMISTAGDRPAEDASPLSDRSAELEKLEARTRVLSEAAAELAGQLDGAESHLLDVSGAIEAEARADAEVQRLTCLAEDLDYATEILRAAQQKVHADIAPVLNETLRPWVPRITHGRYDEIRVNPATLELEVHEIGGQFRSSTVLSHGTTEQLFLLLRLALAGHLATTGESAPVVLDDVTVQSDSQRTVAILNLLRELSRNRQVILFSQEDEVLHWAEETLKAPADVLIRLG